MAGLPAALTAAKAAFSGLMSTAVIGSITVGNIIAASLVVNGIMQARQARKAARRAFEDSMQDRTLTIQSATAAHVWIYGRARVGGVFVRKPFTSGEHSEYLHLQLVLAGHEVDAIEDIWFGDESIGTLDANGYVTGGRYLIQVTHLGYEKTVVPVGLKVTLPHVPDSVSVSRIDGDQSIAVACTVDGADLTFDGALQGKDVDINYRWTENRPLVRVKKFLGIAAGERDTDLEAISSEWKATHLGKGRARIHVTLRYDEGAFPAGLPKITAVVRGRKLYDPRTGSTIWKQNAALAARDYIVNAMGESPAAVNDTLVAAAANICDEAVPVSVGGTHDRYTCDGVISTADDRITNLGAILTAMCGTAVYSGGVWCIRAGAYVVPSMSLDDHDIAPGQIELVTEAPTREVFNAVRGKIVDSTRLYQEVDFPPYESAAYAAEDGEVIYADIALPMTDNAERAQRIAKQILHRSRQSMGLRAPFFLNAAALQPTDTAEISIEYFGHVEKVFRVVDRRFVFPSHVELALAEEAPEAYSWSYTEAIGYDPAPNTNLPAPWFVPALDNLSIASGSSYYRMLTDGSVQYVMRLTWDQSTDIGVRSGGALELYIKRASDAAYQLIPLDGDETSYEYDVANGERYNVAIRARNGAQARSNYTFAEHQVSGAGKNTVSTGSITGDRFASLPNHTMSITPDPGFEDLSLWTMSNVVRVSSAGWGRFGKWAIYGGDAAGGDTGVIVSAKAPIELGKNYRAIARATTHSGDRLLYLFVVFYDANGDAILGTTDPAGWIAGSRHYFEINLVPSGTEIEYSRAFGPAHDTTIPADATHVAIGALLAVDDETTRTGNVSVSGLRIQQLQDTELIAPGAATDVLVIRTTGYTIAPGGTGGGGVRVSGGVSAPDLEWTNDRDEDVDVVIRGSASVSVVVTASAVRLARVGIVPSNASGASFWSSSSPIDEQVAVMTPAVNGTYHGSAAPSLAITVAAGATIRYNLGVMVDTLGDNYSVSDGQLSMEVIKR